MLASELINHSIPQLVLQDSVSKALQLINDFRVTHLPVVSEEKYLGLISEDDLLDVEEERILIESLQDNFITSSINSTDHFLNAVNYCTKVETSIVPVVTNTHELLGIITTPDLLKALGTFSGAAEIGGIIVLEMERSQFYISEISKIVESNNSTVLHLNTTVNPESGVLRVTLHLNNREINTIVATFMRYEYNVLYSFGNEVFDNETKNNYEHLMNYLDL